MGKTILKTDLKSEGIPVYSATQSDDVFGYIENSEILLKKGDLVIPARGNSIGYVTLVNDKIATSTQTTIASNLSKCINSEYIYFVCICFKDKWFISSGAAIPQFTVQQINELIFPLPPLAEQERIVKYIKPIINNINQKNINEDKLINLRNKLKSKILDKAIKGELVHQCKSDEPASVLIQKILDKKMQLMNLKEIKKENLSIIYKDSTDNQFYEKFDDGTIHNITDEIPFDIPDNWQFSRLGNISNYSYNISVDGKNIGDEEWILELEDIEKNSMVLLNKVKQKERKAVSNKNVFHKGEILYGKLRPYLNKTIIADENGYCSTEIIPFSCYNYMYNKYVQFILISNYFSNRATHISFGTKMPRLGTKDAIKFIIPVPPFNEQHKIVEKIEKLFNFL